jgi:hypothetical protein
VTLFNGKGVRKEYFRGQFPEAPGLASCVGQILSITPAAHFSINKLIIQANYQWYLQVA